jgi:hypothetical protein
VYVLQGDHHSILQPPEVQTLAGQLGVLLVRGEGAGEEAPGTEPVQET